MTATDPTVPISSSPTPAINPITVLAAAQEQHLLLLFVPVKAGFGPAAAQNPQSTLSGLSDMRVAGGVHFAMLYGLKNGADKTLPVPTFQTAPGKDLLVAMAIYDRPFSPYISAFTSQPDVAKVIDALLGALDESGIVPPTDPTSAAFILAHGGVAQQTPAFIQLLMRYNFGDPLLPAATSPAGMVDPPKNPRYTLNATFPGLTVGRIMQNYPGAGSLWPFPPVKINYEI